jgi:membrane protease YdiL (CAAX protease family)
MGIKLVSSTALSSGQLLLAGIGLALAFGFVVLESIPGLVSSDLYQRVWIGIALQWLTTLIVALIAIRGLGLDLRNIGIRRPRLMDWPAMAIVFLAAVILVGLVGKWLPNTENPRSVGNRLFSLYLPLRALLVVTAGVCEEFLFRGYGIEVLARLAKDRWLASFITLFFFTIAHAGTVGWTAQLVVPFLLGASLTLLYLWRGNLVIAMIMHTLIDTIGIILVPLFHGR